MLHRSARVSGCRPTPGKPLMLQPSCPRNQTFAESPMFNEDQDLAASGDAECAERALQGLQGKMASVKTFDC
eukprot:1162093-Pelagomonas_calceolata.AAC.2